MSDSLESLEHELKIKIIEALDLGEDLSPEKMGSEDRLVGGDFGIDSIDVLEMVIMLEKEYGVLIDSKELGEQVFRSLRELATHVAAHRKAAAQ